MLEIRQLTKRYGSLVAVSELDLTIEGTGATGLIGPNGAGKSTVFRSLTGFERPTSGSIRYRGIELTSKRPDQIATSGIRQVFQHPRVIPGMSVLGNVMVGLHSQYTARWWQCGLGLRRVRHEEERMLGRARELLDYVGLDDAPDAQSLTVGQERLLELARALAGDPLLLVCDEPAAGLNESETTALAEVLQRIKQAGTPILLVEHDMGLVMSLCDRLVVLDRGQKIAEGAPEIVCAMPSVIEAYLGTAPTEDSPVN